MLMKIRLDICIIYRIICNPAEVSTTGIASLPTHQIKIDNILYLSASIKYTVLRQKLGRFFFEYI